MTTIDFYFNASDRLQVACRLAAKALAQKKRLLILAPQTEVAQRIDRLLWTWPAIAFVPHCMARDELAAETPVLIAAEPPEEGPSELLLNLGGECPPRFERFERLLEIVSRDEQERAEGRNRYRFYKARGYRIIDHNLAAEAASGE